MNKFNRIVIGLLGLSFVIVIHEFGHFIAAKSFGIGVPLFSIGFGPRLFAIRLGSTIFQIAALPLGGFVAINDAQMDLQPYYVKLIVLLAGIAMNFLFAYCVFLIFKLRNINSREMLKQATEHSPQGLIGPIGIINLISYSASLGLNYLLLILAGLSMSVGFFNLLPVPFLDGGQIAAYTIEALTGPLSETAQTISTAIFFILFILFLLYISLGDIRSLGPRK